MYAGWTRTDSDRVCCLLVPNAVTSTPQWIESVLVQRVVQQMESDGTHEDSSDSPLKGSFKQQTSWMVVLCQVGVPAAVIAHVFGLSEHTVRAIERGISRTKIVSAIKSELQNQLPLLQQSRGFSLDTKLGMLLSGSFLTREVFDGDSTRVPEENQGSRGSLARAQIKSK